jgi:predicted RNA-binding Zn-ribbon protein involved in translation (DUF1610 family)
MKFLCVSCDEPMKLTRTAGPDDGSMTVVFACPSCGRETAMLTNAMETQMVRSLGVKIGGRTTPAEPMEMVRTSLSGARDGSASPREETGAAPPSGSKCPFSGVVAEAMSKHESANAPVWTQGAEERIARVPEFARQMVRKGIEMHALERGYTEIDERVMEEARSRFGM